MSQRKVIHIHNAGDYKILTQKFAGFVFHLQFEKPDYRCFLKPQSRSVYGNVIQYLIAQDIEFTEHNELPDEELSDNREH